MQLLNHLKEALLYETFLATDLDVVLHRPRRTGYRKLRDMLPQPHPLRIVIKGR